MFQHFQRRILQYPLLTVVTLALSLPNLGAPSLWDIDEGNNAEAAREMLESGNWITPTFNFQLRVDKPALLYWLQLGTYRLCGVNEFGARLPSALASLVAVLAVCELARRMFDPATGLLAGLSLACAVMFCAGAHFANPDALLNVLTLLSLICSWHWLTRSSGGWMVAAAAWMGLATLAKGPVGVVLPVAVVGLFLLWERQWTRLLTRQLIPATIVLLLVVLPWHILVGSETRGAFLRGFFLTHNIGRFLSPMENHGGPIWYYAVVLLIGFLPWSVFLGPALWYGGWSAVRQPWSRWAPTWERAHDNEPETAPAATREFPAASRYRFLICWIAVYLVFFTVSSTKLPNYILPTYPAVAILTARFLDRWRRGTIRPANWVIPLCLVCLVLAGIGLSAGLTLAGGVLQLPGVRSRSLPGVEAWAFLGVFLVAGGIVAAWYHRRGLPAGVLGSVGLGGLVFTGLLAASGGLPVDAYKAPRPLVRLTQAGQVDEEVRVGCYEYFQPSLVFYCQREVHRFTEEDQTLEFLRCPLPVYLFVPAATWQRLEHKVVGPARLVGSHHDLYRNIEVVVVTNR